MMELGPLGARLTARQAELVLANSHHLFDLGADAIQAPDLRRGQRQAAGGVVLGAVSDDQDFQADCQPAAFRPVGMPSMVENLLSIFFFFKQKTAYEIPPIVVNALEQHL